ncbi:hypothetical protein FNV43_RR26155 [Rhamnella rubrinervis]|uniref:Uncharacterized protein n=1 Tax=Rhamnella rubrinervis TaxID=2594499 RepID=A0A8K0GM83_9ROSA|nr:hypothetical protein FNV43_RR26155 [Rhamnella rubrinervis]
MASDNNLTLLYQYQDDNREATLLCNVNVLRDDPVVAYNSLPSKLSSFGIDSNEHREIVHKITDCVEKRIRNSISDKGPTVFSLRAKITRMHNTVTSDTSSVSKQAHIHVGNGGKSNMAGTLFLISTSILVKITQHHQNCMRVQIRIRLNDSHKRFHNLQSRSCTLRNLIRTCLVRDELKKKTSKTRRGSGNQNSKAPKACLVDQS